MSLAMLFPGQGSQSIGMLGDLAADSEVRNRFEQAAKILGYDLLEIVNEDPAGCLNQTIYTQTALFVTSFCFYQHWLSTRGAIPVVMTGHSLGELTALACAGAMDFETGLRVVKKRAELMQASGDQRPGSMAAVIGLSEEGVLEACAELSSGQVAPANYNCPGQIVVSGDTQGVDEFIGVAKGKGAKLVKKLPVSIASHSVLMAQAAEEFAVFLADIEFAVPAIPVIHNVDASSRSDSSAIREALVAQLFSPVRWIECVARVSEYSVTQAIECGPGKVLAGLSKRIKPPFSTTGFFDSVAAIKGEQ